MVSAQNTGTITTNGFDAEKYKTLSTRFNAIVKKTQATMMMERLWPHTIAPLCTGGLFITTSWLSLWHSLPPVGKMAGLGAFAVLTAASVTPFFFKGKSLLITRAEAITRLDETLKDPRQPAFMLNDRLATHSDQEAQVVWDLGRLRMLEEWVDKFTVERKKSNFSIIPLIAIAASVAVTGYTAGPHRLDRIKEAFHWQVPPIPIIAKAWISPPDNFRDGALVLDQNTKDSTHGGEALEAHKNSKMTIVIYDTNTTIMLNGAPLVATKTNITKDGGQTKSTFQYDIDLVEGKNAININNEIFWNITVGADNAPSANIKGFEEDKKNPGVHSIIVDEKDDYGVRESELTIIIPDAPNPEAIPLPSGKIPSIQLR